MNTAVQGTKLSHVLRPKSDVALFLVNSRGGVHTEFPDEDGFLDDEDRIAELIRSYH